jgi:hypothetical protein
MPQLFAIAALRVGLQGRGTDMVTLVVVFLSQVYEAVFAMYTRDFKRAAERFLESMATFTT